MNINEILDAADEYRWAVAGNTHEKRQALRAAIEAALGSGEPVDEPTTWKTEWYPPQPQREWKGLTPSELEQWSPHLQGFAKALEIILHTRNGGAV